MKNSKYLSEEEIRSKLEEAGVNPEVATIHQQIEAMEDTGYKTTHTGNLVHEGKLRVLREK